MERVALDLGIIQIYWYSIFIFLGMLAACIVIHKEFEKREIEEEFFINLSFNSIIFGVIGARLYYVLFNLEYYLASPIEIFKVWNGGLAIHGGIIAALIFIAIYCKKHKVYTSKVLDMIVVGLILGQAIGRWGNFFNSEAYGAITTAEELQKLGLPNFIIDGMYILGNYRQPTFFYESIWCLFGFLAMLIVRKYKYLKRGQLTGFYLLWYGIERYLVEAVRADSLMFGPVKIAQIVSLIYIAIGIYMLFIKSRKKDDCLYNGPTKIYEEDSQVVFVR
jgi:phosphatidylglycerol:prolipoprotein diacylglycerol transferase